MKPRPETIAWEKFKKANPVSFRAETLGSDKPDLFLENRLHNAFFVGWDAAERAARKDAK